MEKVTKNLSYKEVIKSITATKYGINNHPNSKQLFRIKQWSENIFEPIRKFIGGPLGCHSIFRSEKLNKLIGGADGSQHLAFDGAAGDIDADIYGVSSNEDIFQFIKDNLNFDQVILEGLHEGRIEWLHVSYVSQMENRNKILMMYVHKGKTVYEYYTPERFNQIISKFK